MKVRHPTPDTPKMSRALALSFVCSWRFPAVGINHFETARGYGCSELQYGIALKRCMDEGLFKREDYVLQTKVAPMPTKEKFAEMMKKSIDTLDLEGNGLGHIDLFAFHGINSEKKLKFVLEGGCMDVIRDYQKQGKIKWVGFSTHGMEPLITKACATGQFDYVNLHHQFIGSFTASGTGATGGTYPSIEAARAQDMGVFIISPTDKGGCLYKAPVKFQDACAPLSAIEFNNLWLLNLKDDKGEHVVHTLVIGTARPSDFDEHMKSVAKIDQAPELVPPIEAKLRGMYEEANGKEWCENWWKGLPDPFGNIDGEGELVNVPQNPHVIHYGVIPWLTSICKAWDFQEFARQRYGMLVGNGKKLDEVTADGKTSEDYVLNIMGDFGPGCDPRSLDASVIAASIEGSPCKDAVLAYIEWAKENLHPDKETEMPPTIPDMRPDICWPDRPKPKNDDYDWSAYIAGKHKLLCGLIGASETAGTVDAAALGSFLAEGATVTIEGVDGGLEGFVAGGNIDLAIISDGVKGTDTLEETGKFSHAHKDLRSQVKKGTYTAKWAKGAADFSLTEAAFKYE